MRSYVVMLAIAILFGISACTTSNGTTLFPSSTLAFRGTVSAISSDTLVLNNKVFLTSPGTQYFNNENQTTAASAIKVGDYALFDAVRQDNGSLLITKFQVLDDTSEDLEAAGTITAVNPTSITINGINWAINGSTEFDGFSSPTSLVVGQMAQVEGPMDSNGNFTASEITTAVESTDVGHAGGSEG